MILVHGGSSNYDAFNSQLLLQAKAWGAIASQTSNRKSSNDKPGKQLDIFDLLE